MAKVQIGGAGGAPSNNFIRSLRQSNRHDHLIGSSSSLTDLFLADVDERHVILPAAHKDYPTQILKLLNKTKPDFLHLQHDFEVRAISRMRQQVEGLGVKLYLPDAETIENCVNKYKTYALWKAAGVVVPETIFLKGADDLKRAFEKLGDTIWIRANEGGGGTGALPTDNYDFAFNWIEGYKGWGGFSACKLLTDQSVTWLSIWHEGELVVAQGRRRWSWNFGNRTLSGVTGITGVGETIADSVVDKVAQDAIQSIDSRPHGIFAVDMTYDQQGWPNPTEINIGRFFTTSYFFTRAGLNMAEIYCDIALDNKFPVLENKINPLPSGLLWIRGMDTEPVLTTVEAVKEAERNWSGSD